MLVHQIIDYSFLYYKYKFQLDAGKIRRLTVNMDWNGEIIDKDISQVYYSIKEIEGFRRKLENAGHDVIVSVCFDMPSARKQIDSLEASSKYKSNRGNKLTDDDFENIRFAESLLSRAGYNTYRFKDYEADDIIAHLINNYSSAFDYNIIYTPDLDLLVHINHKVGASRYKAKSGYNSVDISNFSEYLSQELKCNIPYNALLLYKSTVGDKSDCIDGIKKFGPKAFDKLVYHLDSLSVEWEEMSDWRVVESCIKSLETTGYFNSEQVTQALESLSLVRSMAFDNDIVRPPIKQSSKELRESAYGEYGMKSLID